MNTSQKSSSTQQEDIYIIDFNELFSTFLSRKKTIASITLLSAILAIIISLQIPNQYQAKAVVAPSKSQNSSLSSILSSQVGGLASIAGINLGGSEVTSEPQIALAIIRSWSFIENFIDDNNLETFLIAVEGWDHTNNKPIFNTSVYNSEQDKWLVDRATSWQLYKSFNQKLSISEDRITGLIEISIEYYSPIIAKEWIDILIESINNHMRLRKLKQTNINIDYLQEQISKTSIAEMKSVFYDIVKEQTKTKMLAEANAEYVFVTINKAMIPVIKSQPVRSIIVIVSTLLGFIFSLLLVLFQKYFYKTNT
jgi:LPS O-antigen subunit length determinant protein (WzzB/FepE family)